MSESSSHESPQRTEGRTNEARLIRQRVILAGLILLVEYLAISFAFDAQTVATRGGVWTVLGEAGRIGPLFLVGATALFLSPAAKRRDLLVHLSIRTFKPGLLGLHLISVVAFLSITRLAFGPSEPPGPALVWMLIWGALGALVPASLFIAFLADWSWLSKIIGRALALGGLLGLVAWGAGSLSTGLWEPLSYATFLTVGSILHYAGFELYADVASRGLELEGFAIDIAPVCSGFEGIGLFFVLMIGFLYQMRDVLRFPRALLLLPLGMAAVWYGNAFRIAALMVVGARLDAGVAIGSFHSKAGWLFFCAITLVMAFVAGRTNYFLKASQVAGVVSPTENRASPLLIPLLVWMALGLASSSFSQGHDPFYPLRVVVTVVVLVHYRRQLLTYLQKPSLLSLGVGALVGGVWLLLPNLSLSGVLASSQLEPTEDPGFGVVWVVFRVLGTIAVVPICEELAFRGVLTRWTTNREFWKVPLREMTSAGIILSSLAFGVVHQTWVLATATGVVYALLVRRSGRLADGVAAHSASNAVIAIWVLTTGDFRFW
jgi:exosortase E/protease (VPEID-CTERM system)